MSIYSPSDYVLAGILGNWQGESGINPGIWESLIVPLDANPWAHEYQYDGIGGYGLGQWTNVGTPYGRAYNLWSYMTTNGYAMTDGYGECAFLEMENYWTPKPSSVFQYQTLSDFMNSASTNEQDLCHDYCLCWEGILASNINTRMQWASNWLSYIQNNSATWSQLATGPTWIAANAYLGQSDMENNAFAAWWYWNMGIGPGPGPTPGTFPSLWLMFAFGKKIPKGYRKIRGN